MKDNHENNMPTMRHSVCQLSTTQCEQCSLNTVNNGKPYGNQLENTGDQTNFQLSIETFPHRLDSNSVSMNLVLCAS